MLLFTPYLLNAELEGDRDVALEELDASDAYDGAAFAEEYRRARYPA